MLDLTAIAVIVITGLMMFGAPHAMGTEEQGVWNFVYMQLEYGRHALPALAVRSEPSWFDYAWNHPPTHYALVALPMRLGASLYYAIRIPMFVYFCGFVLVVARAPFRPAVSMGILMGAFYGVGLVATLLPVDFGLHLRPGFSIAMCWILSLLALERGRVMGWHRYWLCLGAAGVAFTATMHYWATVMILGLAPYCALMLWQLPRREGARNLLFMLGTSAAVFLPWWMLYVQPYLVQLLEFSRSRTMTTETVETVRVSLDFYARLFSLNRPANLSSIPLGVPVLALWQKGLLPGALGVCMALAVRELRGLVLLTLPFLLYFTFALHRKQPSYFHPEMLFCLVALGGAFGVLVSRLTDASGSSSSLWPYTTFAVGALAIILWRWPAVRPTLGVMRGRVHPAETIRALLRAELGPGRLVGSAPGLWYTAGADLWFDPAGELTGTLQDASSHRLGKHFSSYDATALYSLSLHQPRSGSEVFGAYLDGELHIDSFFLAQTPGTSPILFSAKPRERLVGFFLEGGNVWRFEEHPEGTAAVVAVHARWNGRMSNMLLHEHRVALDPIQKSAHLAEAGIESALAAEWFPVRTPDSHWIVPESVRAVIIAVIPWQAAKTLRSDDASIGSARTLVRGEVSGVEIAAAVEALREGDHTIQFFRTQAEAIQARRAGLGANAQLP